MLYAVKKSGLKTLGSLSALVTEPRAEGEKPTPNERARAAETNVTHDGANSRGEEKRREERHALDGATDSLQGEAGLQPEQIC